MMKEISEPKIDPKTGRVEEMNSIYMMCIPVRAVRRSR